MAKPVNAASLFGPAASTRSKVTIADEPPEPPKRKPKKTDVEHKLPSAVVDLKGSGVSDKVEDVSDDHDADTVSGELAPELTEGTIASSEADKPPISAYTLPVKIETMYGGESSSSSLKTASVGLGHAGSHNSRSICSVNFFRQAYRGPGKMGRTFRSLCTVPGVESRTGPAVFPALLERQSLRLV
jgi:hypothetical protein